MTAGYSLGILKLHSRSSFCKLGDNDVSKQKCPAAGDHVNFRAKGAHNGETTQIRRKCNFLLNNHYKLYLPSKTGSVHFQGVLKLGQCKYVLRTSVLFFPLNFSVF